MGGLNLLVDQNGEEIAKKAEERLRTELKRQSENMLDKKMIIEHLKRLRDNQEEFIKSFEQSNRIEILYDEQKQPVLDSGEQQFGASLLDRAKSRAGLSSRRIRAGRGT